MARVKNTMELIGQPICNGFRFGYMQGRKAAIAEIKKLQSDDLRE